ncbi:hypothetical protein OG943_32330 [Amycolatopsis sp. NBC_00345]|uniref:hypothetical protein n=1 Tax=Amycolatopsis sp. NBC_00345 TaxID=2975955 RepID=UPI002E26EFD1
MQPDPITSTVAETALPLNLAGGQFQEVSGPPEPFLDPLNPGPSGHFEIDPDGLAAQVRVFEDLLDRSATATLALQSSLRQLSSPSPDEPAIEHANATGRSLAEATRNCSRIDEYLHRFVDALRKANGTYTVEDTTLGELFRK